MSYVGGVRARLISDSVYHLIYDNLELLGWFDSGRSHRPITVKTEPYANREDIPLNAMVISDSLTTDEEAEMGSNLGDISTTHYVDFYSENEAIGKEVIHDVRDILKGRMPDIGRVDSMVPVYDWSVATPPLLFKCEIQDLIVEQVHETPKPFQSFWWLCRFDVVDTY